MEKQMGQVTAGSREKTRDLKYAREKPPGVTVRRAFALKTWHGGSFCFFTAAARVWTRPSERSCHVRLSPTSTPALLFLFFLYLSPSTPRLRLHEGAVDKIWEKKRKEARLTNCFSSRTTRTGLSRTLWPHSGEAAALSDGTLPEFLPAFCH